MSDKILQGLNNFDWSKAPELTPYTWACSPIHLRSLADKISTVRGGVNLDVVAQADEAALTDSGMVLAGSVATIPIRGFLMPTVAPIMKAVGKIFGTAFTGMDDLRFNIAVALADPTIETIILDVESPGGSTGGVAEAADAIFAARSEKKVIASVSNIAGSGALWLASQAEVITSNQNAAIGAIGAFTVMVDSSKAAEDEGFKVILVSSGEVKGAGTDGVPIPDAAIENRQKFIDDIAGNFIESVARGRGMAVSAVEKLADGSIWSAEVATTLGLVDGVRSFDSDLTAGIDGISGALALEGNLHGESIMSNSAENQGAPKTENISAPVEEAKAPVVEASEKPAETLADYRAAFPGDLEYAVEAYEAGTPVIEAKAAYADKLVAERDALAAELATAKEAQAVAETATPSAPEGSEPVVSEGEGAPRAGGDNPLLEAGTRLFEEGKAKSITEGMKIANRRNSGLYTQQLEKSGQGTRGCYHV